MPNVFPILINWTSPFPILGVLGGIFYFYSNFKMSFCKKIVEKLSDQILHCLSMSHKKDARRIRVNESGKQSRSLSDGFIRSQLILIYSPFKIG